MAESEKSALKEPVSPIDDDRPPESPTTARALDFDSDQETGTTTPIRTTTTDPAPKPPPKDEAAPPKPPRPLSPREQAELTLREAFPSLDASVIKAVLSASGGQVEPAFNALLGMTDPDAQKEPEPPARPPRPARQPVQNQVDADEMYARQLQEHFSNTATNTGVRSNRYNENLQGSRPGRPGASPNPDDVPWRSFIDDDLPEIRDNIRKGFIETQSTVNKWITNFRKRLDGEEEGEGDQFSNQSPQANQNYGAPPAFGNRRSQDARRSADLQRYDADPQVIGDDFSKLELRDGEAPPRTSSRPISNPALSRTGTGEVRKSSPASGRKVSFQSGPPEEIRNTYSPSPKPAAVQPSTTNKSSKWQPLASVEPSPVGENDPFSLGDSDDERDAKPITMKDDEDERVQKATSEAMSDSIGGDKTSAKK